MGSSPLCRICWHKPGSLCGCNCPRWRRSGARQYLLTTLPAHGGTGSSGPRQKTGRATGCRKSANLQGATTILIHGRGALLHAERAERLNGGTVRDGPGHRRRERRGGAEEAETQDSAHSGASVCLLV